MQALDASTESQTRSETLSNETKDFLVNGDAGEISATESQNAAGEGSGGSDTDISRPGSVDPAKQPSGHLRTNSSAKKPASFKSVSVTKNFLAKSAVTAPVTRPGDKAPSASTVATSALQTARPRLVAKSGGGNTPRSLGKLNGAGSGPDASKVWNKNQPVPPAPPKQFTDEELKQQYGIHLATRLQADDGGKEAKWADIDDDEDDWTPETVQWMDGTKSTVAAENQAPPVEEPKPAPKPEAPIVAAKAASTPAPGAQRTILSGGTKTILKPGANAQANAIRPKGQAEKATLVAKPSPAAPVKSPWAPLPPVEKVSPVQINPPAQQAPSRYSRDSHGYDDVPAPHALAKEIAPDDFNRAWRDERGNRELFNSHSGRYEPVGEMRRGSTRDSGHRQQPSVLQRPSQDGGPAEPSAAFQTSRSSADGPGWGRRRNSSNVSAGSGRRMSFDRRGPDLGALPVGGPRRDSQVVGLMDAGRHVLGSKAESVEGPTASPSMVQVQPVSPLGSAASPAPGPSQEVGTSPAGAPSQIVNLVEVQERLLHANIDAIKLRKQKEKEQEAREEAERKERLRMRLEAMGFTDDAKPKAKEQSPSRLPQRSPQKERAAPALQSPPKPPVPTSGGEVAQYGMMKVHAPEPVKKPHSPPKTQTQADAQPKPLPSLATSVSVQTASNLSRDTDTDTHPSHPPSAHSQTQHPQQSRPADTKASQPPQAPWSQTLPQQRPVGWGSSGSSVWGPPQARDRALGNGTFGQQVPQPPQSSAKPINLDASVNNQPIPLQQNMYSQPVPALAQASVVPKPGPIGPPIMNKAWANFHAQIRQDDHDLRVKSEESRERGVAYRAELRETFHDRSKGKKEATLHDKVATVEPIASQPSPATDAVVKHEVAKAHDSSVPIGQGAPHQPATQGGRSSRFFPKPQPTAKQESPPPPETESHPAFSGDTSHPVVRMPKPPPRVRLPPAAVGPATQLEAPVSMPPRSRIGLGARPLALTKEWQARFNSLLEKPTAQGTVPAPIARPTPPGQLSLPAKPGSLAIAPSSKAPLEVRETSASATVSLPVSATRKSFTNDGSSDITTRSEAEYLLEDRAFGSLPTVKMPKTPHLAANEPPAGFPPNTRQHSKFGPKYYPTTKPTLLEDRPDKNDSTIDVTIRIGKMTESITKKMPIKRKGGRNLGQHKTRRSPPIGTDNASSGGQNPRSRKPSNYQGQGTNPSSSPRGSTGGAWSNNRSTPAHTNPWNTKRQAPAAPVH